jgi:predicted metal-dependent hydrolase
LPEHLRDYILVHEICHLIEFNHGRAFWSLVERQVPDYKALRQELKAQ